MIMLSIDIDVFTFVFQNKIIDNNIYEIDYQICESWINLGPTSLTRPVLLVWNIDKSITRGQIIKSYALIFWFRRSQTYLGIYLV